MSKDNLIPKAGNQKSSSSTVKQPISFIPAYGHLMTEDQVASIDERRILGKVFFEPNTRNSSTTGHKKRVPYPQVRVQAPQLQKERLIEVWTSPGPVQRIEYNDDIQISANNEILYGCVRKELPLAGEPLEKAVYDTYESILKLVEELDYPNVLRIWNYIPRIGSNVDGLECYRRFCRARHHAFADLRGDFLKSLPAASAVGVTDNELTVLFFAARREAQPRENPRQVSAYQYPRLYGPRSPSFARATLVPWWGTGALFISGMASIIGHESRHLGDPKRQLNEAIDNVRTMVAQAIERDGLDFRGFESLSNVRVYLRNPEYLETARAQLEPLLLQNKNILYLQADICRNELLVEIEGALLPQGTDC